VFVFHLAASVGVRVKAKIVLPEALRVLAAAGTAEGRSVSGSRSGSSPRDRAAAEVGSEIGITVEMVEQIDQGGDVLLDISAD
jgi:hypothetical protein